MDKFLKVQHGALAAKAGELSNEKTAIIGHMDQAKSDINSLASVWISPAASEYQGRFKQIYDDIENMLAIITEYVSDLNELDPLYRSAEDRARSVAEGLPTDGVFRV